MSKCAACPVPQGQTCIVEVWGGVRPHCDWIADGREDVRASIVRRSAGVVSPPKPDPPTGPALRSRLEYLRSKPAWTMCRYLSRLPEEIRSGCGCVYWCSGGRSLRPDGKVDRWRCEQCQGEADTPARPWLYQLEGPGRVG